MTDLWCPWIAFADHQTVPELSCSLVYFLFIFSFVLGLSLVQYGTGSELKYSVEMA